MLRIDVIERKKEPTPQYPCLMQREGDGAVVLFFRDSDGVILRQGADDLRPAGMFSSYWAMAAFKPFSGSVTLRETAE